MDSATTLRYAQNDKVGCALLRAECRSNVYVFQQHTTAAQRSWATPSQNAKVPNQVV